MKYHVKPLGEIKCVIYAFGFYNMSMHHFQSFFDA